MTARERIERLYNDGGFEPHMIAAILGLSTAVVAETLKVPGYEPGLTDEDQGAWVQTISYAEHLEHGTPRLEARKEGNVVRFQGAVKAAEAVAEKSLLLELPEGYAPPAVRHIGAVKLHGETATAIALSVATDGKVSVGAGVGLEEGDEVFLDGETFTLA